MSDLPDETDDAVDENEELLLETEAPDDDGEQSDDEDGEEAVLTLGEEQPEGEASEEDTPAIRRLRARVKELNKEVRQFREAPAVITPPKLELGPKPTLESCDFDTDRHEAELEAWIDTKTKIAQEEKDAATARERANAALQTRVQSYEKQKSALMIPGKEEYEEEALSRLSHNQRLIITKLEKSAAVMIALGKYPKKLEAVAAIDDLIDFTIAIADIQRELKVTARRKAPEPDTPVRGSATLSGASTAVQKEKDKIYEQMTKGGDVTKLRARLRQLDAR